jgi:hypothetical protein
MQEPGTLSPWLDDDAVTASTAGHVLALQNSEAGTNTVAVFESASDLRENLPVAHKSCAAQVFALTLSKALANPLELRSGLAQSAYIKGLSHAQLVNLSVNHPLFAGLSGAGAGPVNPTQFVRHVYFNVAAQYPEPDALAYYAGILSRGEMTTVQLGLLASGADINAITVNLAGLASTGLEYFALG